MQQIKTLSLTTSTTSDAFHVMTHFPSHTTSQIDLLIYVYSSGVDKGENLKGLAVKSGKWWLLLQGSEIYKVVLSSLHNFIQISVT